MLKTVLKFSIAAVLCLWLFQNGKLDFSLITQAFHLGHWWILGVLLIGAHLFISSYRFKTLLDANLSTPVSYLKVISFDAIGNMFSFVLPGTAAGDLTRLYYYNTAHPKLTSGKLASYILVDRFMGVISLLSLASVVVLVQYDFLVSVDSRFKLIIVFYLSFLAALSSVIFIVITQDLSNTKWLQSLLNNLNRFPKIKFTLGEMLAVRLSFKTFCKCMLISFINHASVIIGFWSLIIPFLPARISFLNVVSIIPIGLIGSAMPISPAGLGVGHMLFENLFNLFNVDKGASLYNLFYLVTLLVGLAGIFPYLYTRKS